MSSEDAILELIKTNGPLLPVEIGNKLGFNSYIANAYLSDLIEKGIVKRSKEVIGSDFLFYIEGQDKAVQDRLGKLKASVVKTAKTYSSSQGGVSSEVLEKREKFKERLKEIEAREVKPRQTTITDSEKEEFVKRFTPEVEESKPMGSVTSIIKKTVSSFTKKPEKVNLIELAEKYLKENNCNVLEKDVGKKKTECNYLVNTDSSVGELNFLVKVRDKKTINEADLSLAYTEGLKKQVPVLLLTGGKLTKTAEEYLKRNHMIRARILGK